MTDKTPKPDLTLMGQVGYEVVSRELLHLQGGREISVVLHLEVEDPNGDMHKVLARMSEEQFIMMMKDVALDITAEKRKAKQPPPSLGGMLG